MEGNNSGIDELLKSNPELEQDYHLSGMDFDSYQKTALLSINRKLSKEGYSGVDGLFEIIVSRSEFQRYGYFLEFNSVLNIPKRRALTYPEIELLWVMFQQKTQKHINMKI